MGGETAMRAVDLGQLRGTFRSHGLHLRLRQISPCAGADVGQTIPLVHPKLSHAHLHVQPVVVFLLDVALGQVLLEHLLVDLFTPLDLRNQPPPCLREAAQGIAKEILPPFMLSMARPRRSLSGPNTDKDPDLPARPFVNGRFIES